MRLTLHPFSFFFSFLDLLVCTTCVYNMGGWLDGYTDGWSDGRTDGHMDVGMYLSVEAEHHVCPSLFAISR